MIKRIRNKLPKAKDLSWYIREADRLFSLYIRQRDNNRCITCGKFIEWRSNDCGHFISRKYYVIRWNVQNANLQCKHCNMYCSGNQFEHGKKIDLKFGEGTAEKLYLLSKMQYRLTTLALQERIKELKKLLKDNNFEIK